MTGRLFQNNIVPPIVATAASLRPSVQIPQGHPQRRVVPGGVIEGRWIEMSAQTPVLEGNEFQIRSRSLCVSATARTPLLAMDRLPGQFKPHLDEPGSLDSKLL